MSLKQKKIKFKPRIKLNHNSNIFHLCRYFIGKTETVTFRRVARLFNIPHLSNLQATVPKVTVTIKQRKQKVYKTIRTKKAWCVVRGAWRVARGVMIASQEA